MASMAAVPPASSADGATAAKQGHSAKIFVGNLPFKTTRTDLAELFCPFGGIVGVNIRKDRHTDKSRGFAFVTFATDDAAVAAIAEMHGKTLEGRALTVKSALARGQQGGAAAASAKEEADNSGWATAPPRRRRGGGGVRGRRNGRRGGRGDYAGDGRNGGGWGQGREGRDAGARPKQKSWTEWATFPVEQSNGSGAAVPSVAHAAAYPAVTPLSVAPAAAAAAAASTAAAAAAAAEPASDQ